MSSRYIRLADLLGRRSISTSIYDLKHIDNVVSVNKLSEYLCVSESEVEYLCMKHPVIRKLDESKLRVLKDTIKELGFPSNVLLEKPALFGLLPQSLKLRYKVLNECGITKISPSSLVSYLSLVKQKTVGQLKQSGEISTFVNVENRLAGYMTQWPTSLTTLVSGDVNEITLYNLRLKILQRYLELVLDITNVEFERGLQTYPTIKHRPLEFVNETLQILKSQFMISNHKIKSNLYLIHSDPDNLKNIMLYFRSIGGIDIKEVVRTHPKIATKNYKILMEIKKILQEYGIDNEAQKRCFDIYTLAPKTVKERLENAKNTPEFATFYNHPRYLKMIHYKNTAMNRMLKLYKNNKKCLSLNILSGSSAHYEVFEKAPGDKLGKGKDLLFCVSQSLGNKYGMSDIRRLLKRHPFWINVPLIQVKFVCEELAKKFNYQDIYTNCPIVLYPWNKIRNMIKLLENQSKNEVPHCMDSLNYKSLDDSQKLSLVLYLLEKNHYFSGNGVWIDDKTKVNCDISNYNVKKELSMTNS